MHQVSPDPPFFPRWVGSDFQGSPPPCGGGRLDPCICKHLHTHAYAPPCGGGRLEVTIYAGVMHVHGSRHACPFICKYLHTHAHKCIHMRT